VELIIQSPDFFDYIHLIPDNIIEELKKYSRYCNHPDEQPIFSTVNIIGEHRWSFEEKKKYFNNIKETKFLAYRKIFCHFFPNEPFPAYDRLKFMGDLSFVDIIDWKTVLFCEETKAKYAPKARPRGCYDEYSNHSYILETKNKYIGFNILSRAYYHKRDENLKSCTRGNYLKNDPEDLRSNPWRGVEGFITDLSPQLNLEKGNSIFIDRRTADEKNEGVEKWFN